MTQLWWNSNSTCRAIYWMHIPSFKLISQSMLKKSPEKSDGQMDGQTDGHCHSIIHPFFKRAHKKEDLIVSALVLGQTCQFCHPEVYGKSWLIPQNNKKTTMFIISGRHYVSISIKHIKALCHAVKFTNVIMTDQSMRSQNIDVLVQERRNSMELPLTHRCYSLIFNETFNDNEQ